MPIVILALVVAPSLIVFLAGCALALYRTYGARRRRVARLRPRDRTI
ncbi:MAG: hypothetical protein ACJ767_10430 [Chloroflexota bacterium]